VEKAKKTLESENVDEMKKEFNYWYPVDLRVSGKDLLGNHLVMALYSHRMIWNNNKYIPRGYSANGYIMINGEKMSKSGTFMTLREAVEKHGADATRIALAKGADSLNDANFDENNAIDAVMLLNNESEWIAKAVQAFNDYEGGITVNNIWDRYFVNAVDDCIVRITQDTKDMNFTRAFVGIHNMLIIRDKYRNIYESGMITDKIAYNYLYNTIEFIKKLVIVLSPFVPHWTTTEIENLRAHGISIEERWPDIPTPDKKYIWMFEIFFELASEIRKKHANLKKKKRLIDTPRVEVYLSMLPSKEVSDTIASFCDTMQKYPGKTTKEVSQMVMEETDKGLKQYTGRLLAEVSKNIDTYGDAWIVWIKDIAEYSHILRNWLGSVIADIIPDVRINEVGVPTTDKKQSLYQVIPGSYHFTIIDSEN